MSKYHDDTTAASDLGGVRLQPHRLHAWGREEILWRELANGSREDDVLGRIDEHLQLVTRELRS